MAGGVKNIQPRQNSQKESRAMNMLKGMRGGGTPRMRLTFACRGKLVFPPIPQKKGE